MDENILTLLEELSLRGASFSEDETKESLTDLARSGTTPTNRHTRYLSSNYTSSSNVSSPTHDQLDDNSTPEDVELKSAVSSLFHELSSPNQPVTPQQTSAGYDKSKLLVALLGNIDLVTCAVKKINHLVSLGKKMEQIYRSFYQDPGVPLNLEEINQLITSFSNVYNSEGYVREVNVSRVYQAYCKKLMDIYETRRNQGVNGYDETSMMMH